MAAPRLDMIGLVCKSIPESVRFYGLLGIDVSSVDPAGPYAETTLPGGIRLSWNDLEMIKQIEGDYKEPVGQRIGLAFLCDSPEAVDRSFQSMLDAGFSAHMEPWDAFWGQRYAQVLDPDGNVVDLFAPLPES